MRGLNNDITFSECNEIFHMSDPWMGTLNWKRIFEIKSIMMDSVFTERNTERVYFIRCNMPSNMRKDAYFSLCFIEIETEKAYEVQKKLPSTSLPEITTQYKNDNVVLVQFHNKEFVIDTTAVLVKQLPNEINISKSK